MSKKERKYFTTQSIVPENIHIFFPTSLEITIKLPSIHFFKCYGLSEPPTQGNSNPFYTPF